MLAVHTPAPEGPRVRNELIEELFKKHQYEIVTWPAYLPDQICMDKLRRNTNPEIVIYIAFMKGITPIVTIGDHKSFIADFNKEKELKSNKRKLPKFKGNKEKELEKNAKNKRKLN